MKAISILLLFIMSSVSFAAEKDISVVIDGKSYQCTEGGETSLSLCQSKATAMFNKYNRCKESMASSTCFNKVYGLGQLDCPEVSDSCYDACKESIASSTCFNKCY
jgi:hypothetical protein